MNQKFVKLLESNLSPEQIEIRGEVKIHLIKLKEKALSIWPELAKVRMFKNIKLDYTDDLGDAMAKAWMSLNTIEIELASLAKNTERMFDEVIGHELCHLMVPMIYKGVGYKDEELHGKEWQEIMKKMGFAIDPIDLE
jgi:predicted SprT family Zn-dependent metalloprotease